MNIKSLTRTAMFTTVAAGGLYAVSTIKTTQNDVTLDMQKMEAPAKPIQTPITTGTLFTLGLFGKNKRKEDDKQLTKEQQEARAAAKAGMSVEKYRSLFEPTPKSDFMVLYGFESHKPIYYNTAKEWFFTWDENFNTDIDSVKKGLDIMNNCFEQYEKENIKIFEEKDKARCKQLMAEISEAIEKGENLADDTLDELVLIYDKKRLYPYI